MSQGHVNTTDHDGKPLLLLFLLDDEEDAEEIQKNLDNQVKVLRGFVTAWNRGVKDVEGKDPSEYCKTCNVLLITKQQHGSSYAPDERKHVTVKPVSAAGWASDPPYSAGSVHVYSVSDEPVKGFDSYKILDYRFRKLSEGIRTGIRNAMKTQYTQTSSKTKGESSSSKTTGESSSSKTKGR